MKEMGLGEYIINAIAFLLMLFLSYAVYKKTKVIPEKGTKFEMLRVKWFNILSRFGIFGSLFGILAIIIGIIRLVLSQ